MELAERLLEEVASARQDWSSVAALARQLVALAEALDARRDGDGRPASAYRGPLLHDGGDLYHMGPEDQQLHEDM